MRRAGVVPADPVSTLMGQIKYMVRKDRKLTEVVDALSQAVCVCVCACVLTAQRMIWHPFPQLAAQRSSRAPSLGIRKESTAGLGPQAVDDDTATWLVWSPT